MTLMIRMILCLILVLAFMLYFVKRFFPYQAPPEPGTYDDEVLREKYGKYGTVSGIALLVLTGIMGYFWYLGISAFSEMIHPKLWFFNYLILPSSVFFMLPALFLGMISAVVPMDAFMKLLLKERYPEYMDYTMTMMGAWVGLGTGFIFFVPISLLKDPYRLNRRLFYVMTVLSVGLLFMVLDDYTIFMPKTIKLADGTEKPGGIEVNSLLGIGDKDYAYSDIDSIKHVLHIKAPNGDIREQPEYRIYFKDGSHWRLSDYQDNNGILEQQIATYVSIESQKPIVEQDIANAYQ